MIAECLTGSPPAPESLDPTAATERLAVLLAIATGLTPHVAATLQRAASPFRNARFPTVLDFIAALHGTPRAGDESSLPSSQRTSGDFPVLFVDQPRRSRSWLLIGGLAVLIPGAAVGLTWVGQTRQDQVPEVVLLEPPAAAPPTLPVTAMTIPVSVPAPPPAPPPAAEPTASQDTNQAMTTQVEHVASRAPLPKAARATRRTPTIQRPARGSRDRASAGSPMPKPDTIAAGRLFVSSRPWGHLYVDDRPVGHTPKAGLSIPAGRHRIRIARPGFRQLEREILVGSDTEVRLIDLVLEKANR